MVLLGAIGQLPQILFLAPLECHPPAGRAPGGANLSDQRPWDPGTDHPPSHDARECGELPVPASATGRWMPGTDGFVTEPTRRMRALIIQML